VTPLKFGLTLPNYGDCCGYAGKLAELALEAEKSGWDGFFLFDHILYSQTESVPMADPWVALASIATKTQRIKMGTLVTPIARRRPWKLARETVTIDHLSGGRLVLGVGLGDPVDAEFTPFGEDTKAEVRAAKLDEGLEILARLWSGEPFSYRGRYTTVQNVRFLPRPLQTPRIPIWVAGRWPTHKPFLRAARWDGAFPLGKVVGSKLNPDELQAVNDFVKAHRTDASPFDLVATSGAEGLVADEATLAAYAASGVTWWMQDLRKWRNSYDELLTRVRQAHRPSQ